MRTATVVLLLLLAAKAVAAPRAASNCYARETADRLLIGNDRVEVAVDRRTGAVVRLANKKTNTQWIAPGSRDAFALTWSTWGHHGAKVGDLWSAGHGATITTAAQRVSAASARTTRDGALLSVRHESLRLGARTLDVAVTYEVALRPDDEETLWRISIDNKDQGTVGEVRFPVLGPVTTAEALLLPNHGGERIENPVAAVDDQSPLLSLEYPGRASMQWFALTNARAVLSLASHDEGTTYTRLAFGRAPGATQPSAWIGKHPFVVTGSQWQSPPVAVGLHAGTWHRAADRYRTWLFGWTKPPEVPVQVREMTGGGGGLYIKDRTERTVARYEDLVPLARQIPASVPHRSVMLIGWFPNGHDTYFPEYDAIPELGGAAALRDAIKQVHALGTNVTVYMNGRLANIETDTYKRHGKRWALLGRGGGLGVGAIDFFELHERWNPEWARDARGEGWFSVMCPSAKGWQDHIVGQAVHVVRDYGVDGIFLDQPGSYYAELCFNPHHGHATPAHAWGPGLIEIFRRIRTEARAINPKFVISTEGMNDVLGQYLDFHTDKNPVWEPMRVHPTAQTFPELWRYTLPDYVTSNGPVAYSFAPARDKVYGPYYRFVLGVRGIDRRWPRGETGNDEEKARLDAVVAKIERLWQRSAAWLLRGRFVDAVGVSVSSPAAFARAYTTPDAVAVPVWNTTDGPLRVEVTVDLAVLRDGQVPAGTNAGRLTAIRLDDDAPLAIRAKGPHITATIELPAHEADVVVLRQD